MFFEKPKIRYVDMCIYIDEHIYNNDYDESTVYEYLYHIVMMLTTKRNYFKARVDLDDFSMYAASAYYLRLTDTRQFGDNASLEKVRSILNYVRKTLFSIRRDYCKKYVNTQDVSNTEYVSMNTDSFLMYTNKTLDELNRIDFYSGLESVQTTIKTYLMDIPYKYGTPMWNNIYISCMLSFLNSITLKNRDIKRINGFKRPNSLTDELLLKLYRAERYDSTILYHLDSDMYNYITVLTNRIKHKLSADLSQSLHTYTPSYINMKNLLMSNIIGE